MNLRTTILHAWCRKGLLSGILAFLGLAVWVLPFTQALTFFSYDLPFLLRSEIRPSEALIVYMDDESRKRLHQPVEGPWDRQLHTKLLDQLFAQKARAVVFDVLFDEPSKDAKVDEQFAAAIRRHGSVILGATCRYSGGSGEPIVGHLQHATEPLASAAPWGVAELPADTDGTIRRHFYHEQFTNLASQVLFVLGQDLDHRPVPRWINYYGPSGAIPHLSYHQVLGGEPLQNETLSNKIVFVGMAPIINYQGSKSSDEFRTPYTRWTGFSSPGVEIQATATLNLLHQDWLSRFSFSAEMSLLIGCAILFGFFVPSLQPAGGLALIVTIAFLTAALGILLALYSHRWFCWAAISIVEAPVACLWALLPRKTPVTQPSAAQAAKSPLSGASAASASQPAVAAETTLPAIPDHAMIRKFGEGSYGQVWLAKTALGRFRAVKIIYRRNFKSVDPFEREFRGIQSFEPISRKHEGLVDILHVGPNQAKDHFYYVMELADDQLLGQQIDPDRYSPKTLASELESRRRFSSTDCCQIGMSLAGALQELHQRGLVHRDIKPSNIIFVDGILKLADIGLVAQSTDALSFVGTHGYMPPEGPGAPQADIFSLGKVLYQMVTGRSAADFPEPPTIPPADSETKSFAALNRILLKACAAGVAQRYQSAEELQAALKRLSRRSTDRKS